MRWLKFAIKSEKNRKYYRMCSNNFASDCSFINGKAFSFQKQDFIYLFIHLFCRKMPHILLYSPRRQILNIVKQITHSRTLARVACLSVLQIYVYKLRVRNSLNNFVYSEKMREIQKLFHKCRFIWAFNVQRLGALNHK